MKRWLFVATGLWLSVAGVVRGNPAKAPTQDLTKLPGVQTATQDDPLATLRKTADALMAGLTSDARLYPRLLQLCDRFGPRLSGTANLERAIDWILAELVRDGLSTAHGEPVMVPRWVRGEESAEMILPRRAPLAVRERRDQPDLRGLDLLRLQPVPTVLPGGRQAISCHCSCQGPCRVRRAAP